MANLKFKYGSFGNLGWDLSKDKNIDLSKGVPFDEGTVYVTKDERSMFIDLDGKRQRIEGSVQYYTSIDEFNANPPYNNNTLYYFQKIKQNDKENVNALMAYDATTQEWVQINVSLADFTALAKKVDGIKGDATSLSQAIAGLDARITPVEKDLADLIKKVGTLETNLGKAQGDIAQIKSDASTLSGKVDDNTKEIANVKESVSTLSQTVTEEKGKLATLTETVTGLNETVGGHTSSISTLDNTVKDLGSRLDTVEDDINNNSTGIKKSIATINEQITTLNRDKATKDELAEINNTLTESINTNTASIAANAEAISGLQAADTALGNRVTATENSINTINENITAIGQKNDEQDQSIGSLTTGLGTANSNIETLQTTTQNLTKDLGTAQGDITSLKSTTQSLTTDLTAAKGNITTLQKDKADKTEVTKQINAAKTELTGNLNEHIQAANAMTFKGTINNESDLPKTNVRIGDTWVLAEGQTDQTGTTVGASAGDFFIASGEENANGIITGTVTWNHVKSGYDEAFDPDWLNEVTNSSSDKTEENPDGVLGSLKTTLRNFAGKPLSSTTIATASHNISITGTTESNGNSASVNINLVWDTF